MSVDPAGKGLQATLPLSDTLGGVGRFAEFSGRALWRLVTLRVYPAEVIHHLTVVIYRCLVPVCVTLAPICLVMAFQGAYVLKLFGAERFISFLIGQGVFRELGPILTATLLAAQGGASFTAELGSMRVQGQMDATEVMAVDPLAFHVVPRILALGLSAPLLNLLGCVTGLTAGYIATVFVLNADGASYAHTLWTQVSMGDVLHGMLKVCVFGSVIGLLSCYYGFTTEGGAQGVGRAVNSTVVQSIVTFIVLNYLLTTALFSIDV